jgi:hypothetical protein
MTIETAVKPADESHQGLAIVDAVAQRIQRVRRADEIIATLLPLDLHSTGPGNKYETEAYAKTHGISLTDARRDLVLTPTSARIARPESSR